MTSIVTYDQRRGIRPLPPCPNCGGKLKAGLFRNRDGRSVELIADCVCGQKVRIFRSLPRRI